MKSSVSTSSGNLKKKSFRNDQMSITLSALFRPPPSGAPTTCSETSQEWNPKLHGQTIFWTPGLLWEYPPMSCSEALLLWDTASSPGTALTKMVTLSQAPWCRLTPVVKHQQMMQGSPICPQNRLSINWPQTSSIRDIPLIVQSLFSGTKKEPKPKLLSPDIFWWGGGLPCEGVGAKKFGMSLETREIKLFGRDIPGFCRDIPGVPEKFEKKMFVFNSRPLSFAFGTFPGGENESLQTTILWTSGPLWEWSKQDLSMKSTCLGLGSVRWGQVIHSVGVGSISSLPPSKRPSVSYKREPFLERVGSPLIEGCLAISSKRGLRSRFWGVKAFCLPAPKCHCCPGHRNQAYFSPLCPHTAKSPISRLVDLPVLPSPSLEDKSTLGDLCLDYKQICSI